MRIITPNNVLTIDNSPKNPTSDEVSIVSIEFFPPTPESRSEDLNFSILMDQVRDFDKEFLPGNDNNKTQSLSH